MPEKEELIKNEEVVKEESTKEESIIDSKKIDLYINNNEEVYHGMSIMNIFGYLKQRLHLFTYVILICFILGLLIPFAIYGIKSKSDSAVAVLGLDYSGASSGLAPDGSTLDISYIKSSYIIQNALSDVTLSEDVTVAMVQSNLKITGILTDGTKRQKEVLDKLLAEKSNEYAKQIQNFILQYRSQYIITLDSTFRNGNSKVALSNSDTSRLLAAILNSYAEYFNEIYLDDTLPNNYIGAIDAESLDYLEILDEVQSSLSYLENYCSNKASYIPGFRASDGLSFNDLSSIIRTIRSSDIDYIYSYIYLNNISKDSYMALTSYKYQKREATLQLSETNEAITTIKNSIDNYQTDKVVISTTDSSQVKEVEITSDYYNELVGRLTSLNNQKSALEERITILTNRINRLEGAPATDEQVAKAGEYVDSALVNARSIYDLVNSHSQELFSSNAYNNRYMHAIVTTETDPITNYIKIFAIGAIGGLLIGACAWIGDAFILEFKNSKKEEMKGETK